jgi:hypothetical protein
MGLTHTVDDPHRQFSSLQHRCIMKEDIFVVEDNSKEEQVLPFTKVVNSAVLF